MWQTRVFLNTYLVVTWRVVKDVLDFANWNLAVLVELHNVEPAASIFLVVKLEHEIVEEYVPTNNVVFKILINEWEVVTFEHLVKDASAFIIVDLEQVFTTEYCFQLIMLDL